MRATNKIFAITEDIYIQKKIIAEFKNEHNEVVFFSEEFSVFTLMQFQPDMIILDYERKEFIYNQFGRIKAKAA